MTPSTETTSKALRRRLDDLYAELARAGATGLRTKGSYTRDLCNELDEVYAAWTLAVVIERVLDRARVDGALKG